MKRNQQTERQRKRQQLLEKREQKWKDLEDAPEPKPPPGHTGPAHVIPDAFKDIVQSVAIPEDCPDTLDLTQACECQP
jgi:hypothetical protein